MIVDVDESVERWFQDGKDTSHSKIASLENESTGLVGRTTMALWVRVTHTSKRLRRLNCCVYSFKRCLPDKSSYGGKYNDFGLCFA